MHVRWVECGSNPNLGTKLFTTSLGLSVKPLTHSLLGNLQALGGGFRRKHPELWHCERFHYDKMPPHTALTVFEMVWPGSPTFPVHLLLHLRLYFTPLMKINRDQFMDVRDVRKKNVDRRHLKHQQLEFQNYLCRTVVPKLFLLCAP